MRIYNIAASKHDRIRQLADKYLAEVEGIDMDDVEFGIAFALKHARLDLYVRAGNKVVAVYFYCEHLDGDFDRKIGLAIEKLLACMKEDFRINQGES